MDSLDLSDKASKRLKITKEMANAINIVAKKYCKPKYDGIWRIYTFRKDKENINPERFRVFKTRTLFGKEVPAVHIMDIFFSEPNKTITIQIVALKLILNLNEADKMLLQNSLKDVAKGWSIVIIQK